ncbi:MAG: hypothetical protein GF311_16755 [Candidatus Lokiarchaeota archaeon]|nr:hypothetical protein [Candidatus Lokiarchaeota archaeon]
MPTSCIICHLPIDENSEKYDECPNGHAAHTSCLREWLTHSLKCPLCNTKYDDTIIQKFQVYIEKKEQEKRETLKLQMEEENKKKIKEICKNMVFLKTIEVVEKLTKQKEYKKALEMLDGFANDEDKKHDIMFLRGKINFLRGRYDMAINHLFKLVKQDFEFPDAWLYLGRSYQALGLEDKARWAFERSK